MKNINVKLKSGSDQTRKVWVRLAGSTLLDIKVPAKSKEKVFSLTASYEKEFRVDVFDENGKYLDSYTANINQDSSGMIYSSDHIDIIVPYSQYEEPVVKPKANNKEEEEEIPTKWSSKE